MDEREGWCPCCNGEKCQPVTYRGGPLDGKVVLEHISGLVGKYMQVRVGEQIFFAFYRRASDTEMVYEQSERYERKDRKCST